MVRLVIVAVVVFSAALSGGCALLFRPAFEPGKDPCARDEDCADGGRCVDGACEVECVPSCLGPETRLSCDSGSPVEAPCAAPPTCVDGACVEACVAACVDDATVFDCALGEPLACQEGEACVGGACVCSGGCNIANSTLTICERPEPVTACPRGCTLDEVPERCASPLLPSSLGPATDGALDSSFDDVIRLAPVTLTGGTWNLDVDVGGAVTLVAAAGGATVTDFTVLPGDPASVDGTVVFFRRLTVVGDATLTLTHAGGGAFAIVAVEALTVEAGGSIVATPSAGSRLSPGRAPSPNVGASYGTRGRGLDARIAAPPYGSSRLIPLLPGSSGALGDGRDDGGNAIALASFDEVRIDGEVHATSAFSEASGPGSGGAILIEAPTVRLGVVAALLVTDSSSSFGGVGGLGRVRVNAIDLTDDRGAVGQTDSFGPLNEFIPQESPRLASLFTSDATTPHTVNANGSVHRDVAVPVGGVAPLAFTLVSGAPAVVTNSGGELARITPAEAAPAPYAAAPPPGLLVPSAPGQVFVVNDTAGVGVVSGAALLGVAPAVALVSDAVFLGPFTADASSSSGALVVNRGGVLGRFVAVTGFEPTPSFSLSDDVVVGESGIVAMGTDGARLVTVDEVNNAVILVAIDANPTLQIAAETLTAIGGAPSDVVLVAEFFNDPGGLVLIGRPDSVVCGPDEADAVGAVEICRVATDGGTALRCDGEVLCPYDRPATGFGAHLTAGFGAGSFAVSSRREFDGPIFDQVEVYSVVDGRIAIDMIVDAGERGLTGLALTPRGATTELLAIALDSDAAEVCTIPVERVTR